jgi:hypothetical protein
VSRFQRYSPSRIDQFAHRHRGQFEKDLKQELTDDLQQGRKQILHIHTYAGREVMFTLTSMFLDWIYLSGVATPSPGLHTARGTCA